MAPIVVRTRETATATGGGFALILNLPTISSSHVLLGISQSGGICNAYLGRYPALLHFASGRTVITFTWTVSIVFTSVLSTTVLICLYFM